MQRMRGATARRPPPNRTLALLRRLGLRIGVPALLAVILYGGVLLSQSPIGKSTMQYAADRLIDGSARFGLVVTDVRVEGRETTYRETILTALGAGPGTRSWR